MQNMPFYFGFLTFRRRKNRTELSPSASVSMKKCTRLSFLPRKIRKYSFTPSLYVFIFIDEILLSLFFEAEQSQVCLSLSSQDDLSTLQSLDHLIDSAGLSSKSHSALKSITMYRKDNRSWLLHLKADSIKAITDASFQDSQALSPLVTLKEHGVILHLKVFFNQGCSAQKNTNLEIYEELQRLSYQE